MNLASNTVAKVATNPVIVTPQYDRENTEIGIVHLGPGAFHRAHQAVYTENAMNLAGGNWGICGVSLRSATARDVLAKQDNLYTLAILDKEINYQIIGAIKEVLVASEQLQQVMDRLTSPNTKLVTLTITEKGYCLGSDGRLDLEHSDIAHDLSNRSQPISAIGYIVQALGQRKINSVAAFNVLSCDNVSGNGDKLRRAVIDYATQLDAALATWIEVNVAFPNAMVDSITPKTEDYTVDSVTSAIGARDEWPIQREQFTQWVIEDNWNGSRPAWEKVGVVFTSDVDGFEKAKLRLLNSLHSTLAYAGSLAGFETVYDVTSDEAFYDFICQLANQEVIGSFVPPKELNVESYSKEIIERFLNPEIRHLLAQIAWDGSQKVQMRILPIIEDNLALGRSTKLLSLSLACWFEFICRALKEGREIIDPLASDFAKQPALLSNDSAEVVEAFLTIESIFGQTLAKNTKLKAQLVNSLSALRLSEVSNINSVVEKLC
ncbi:mannitol dehydrogenase family protein [Colwellia psychrerythraea]|uniref:Mannitol 2-dehydrogenase n=1 Tax=Colwellia psychrerythraea TaxID=28229 RepID=A0A099KPF6_COLPS|nr:mannitol dehydrogenase family protein [Colwellia psychrerythraea]KGJ92604.1 Mannitol 2-dehydrogenase [Colwellia psychrerythraea]